MAKINIFLLILFNLIQCYDFYSTKRIVADRGGQELNPLLQKLFSLVGVVPGLIISKTIITTAVGYIAVINIHHPVITVLLLVLNGIYTGIMIMYNARQM